MIIVSNYFLALICCIVCCICWGSWANTQKMVAAKNWSFELFYWDYTIGLFLTTVVAAFTLGTFGSEGRTFIEDFSILNWQSVMYAILGGIIWNAGTILLTASIAVAGMSVGFPIGGGIGWIGGIIFNYILLLFSGGSYTGNETLLWVGVIIIIVSILISGQAYRRMSASRSNTRLGIILAFFAGIAIMFFYGLVVKSLDPAFVSGGTGTLTPYTGVFFFGVGILASTPLLNGFAMHHPVSGKAVTMADYLHRGDCRTHLIGILGGVIWMAGMVISFMGAGAANPAISYALSNAAPVVAMIWGVFVWKEFKGAPRGTGTLVVLTFVGFIAGLILISLSH